MAASTSARTSHASGLRSGLRSGRMAEMLNLGVDSVGFEAVSRGGM